MGQIIIRTPNADISATLLGLVEAAIIGSYPTIAALHGKVLTTNDYVCVVLAMLAAMRGYLTNKNNTKSAEQPAEPPKEIP